MRGGVVRTSVMWGQARRRRAARRIWALGPIMTVLLAEVATAQSMSMGLGGWRSTGAATGDTPSVGVRVAGALDWPMGARAEGAGARLEGAFSQGAFTRDYPGRPNQRTNENGLELVGVVHSARLGGSGVRGFAGGAVVVGLGCGTDSDNDPNGLVACPADGLAPGTVRGGGVAGVQRGWNGNALEVVTDLRALVLLDAASRARGPMVGITVWLRKPRR
ncbi:MAG: hypothetical protein RLZ32_2323 [Gemmatimonadota bacterium]